MILFTLTLVGLMIVPQIVAMIAMNGHPEAFSFVDKVEPFAPFGLLFFTMMFVFTSAGEKAITFSPAEVDFLFPAPFSRRELLIYKLLKTGIGLVIMSLLFSIIWRIYFRSWLSGFAGIVLSLALLQLLGMVTALVGQIVSESIYTRVRKVILAVVLLALLTGLGQVARRVQAMGLTELISGVRESQTLRVLLAPFEVFTRTAFAEAYSPRILGVGRDGARDRSGLTLPDPASRRELPRNGRRDQPKSLRPDSSGQGGRRTGDAGESECRPVASSSAPLARRGRTDRLATDPRGDPDLPACVHSLPGVYPRLPRGDHVDAGRAGWLEGKLDCLDRHRDDGVPELPLLHAESWGFRGDVDHIDFLKTLPIHPMMLTIGELAGATLLLTVDSPHHVRRLCRGGAGAP